MATLEPREYTTKLNEYTQVSSTTPLISKVTLPSGNSYNLKDTFVWDGLSTGQINQFLGDKFSTSSPTNLARLIQLLVRYLYGQEPGGNNYSQVDEGWPANSASNIIKTDESMKDAVEHLATIIEGITGGDAIVFKGVSTTALTDGGTENPTISGSSVTAKAIGDLYFYQSEEFIWGPDSKWHSLGAPMATLGALAYKDAVSVKYDKTTSITSTFTGTAGDVTITTAANNSGNYTPSGTITGGTFTGSNSTFTGSYTPGGTVSQPTFSGAVLSSTASYTPGGSVSQPTFSGAELSSTASYTPGGSVSQPTFSGATLSSTASYTPGGSVSTPTISVATAGSTATIKNPTKVTVAKTVAAAAPTSSVANEVTYYSVANENLTLYKIGYTTGDSITTSNVTVKTGDAAYSASQPTFTGTASTVTTKGTPSGTVSQPTFSGTAATITAKGTPSGTVSKPTFSGTASTVTTKGTPSGTVSKPTFSGTPATVTVSGTPNGSVSGLGFNGTKVKISGTITPAGSVTSTPNNTNTNATVSYS